MHQRGQLADVELRWIADVHGHALTSVTAAHQPIHPADHIAHIAEE